MTIKRLSHSLTWPSFLWLGIGVANQQTKTDSTALWISAQNKILLLFTSSFRRKDFFFETGSFKIISHFFFVHKCHLRGPLHWVTLAQFVKLFMLALTAHNEIAWPLEALKDWKCILLSSFNPTTIYFKAKYDLCHVNILKFKIITWQSGKMKKIPKI